MAGAENLNQSRLLISLLLIASLAWFFYYGIVTVWDYTGSDFISFYRASEQMLEGKSPYLEILERTSPEPEAEPVPWGNYIYPTFFATCLFPLTSLDPFWAKKVFVIISICLYVLASIYLIKREYGKGTYPHLALCLVIVALCWGPSIENMRVGQSNILVFLLLFCSWLFLDREMESAGGAALGLACAVKLTPIVALPFFIVYFKPKIVLAGLLAFFASMILIFPRYNWTYFTVILPAMRDFGTMPDVPSVHSLAISVLRVPERMALALTLILYIYFLFALWRRKEFFSSKTVLLYAIFVIAPITGERTHHFMITVLPVLWVLTQQSRYGIRFLGTGWVILMLLLFPFFYYTPIGNLLNMNPLGISHQHILTLASVVLCLAFPRIVERHCLVRQ